ncbi:MAG: cell division protein [Cytophaga sp.]|nr:cell division protein [Cytophaga sp.]
MTIIHLHTLIKAPVERCFDLSRSIDLHQSSMHQSNERAVAGRKAGLIEQGETVTWEATHFFVRQQLSSVISEMKRPYHFIDEMEKGAFKSLWHKHFFQSRGDDHTLMIDEFRYEVPYGMWGRLFNRLILKNYMTALLKSRNEHIRHVAESPGGWQKFLIQ